jgi:rod shape determining protein RodA
VPVLALGAMGIVALVVRADAICQPGVDWPLLRDYQKHRVCTLLDPTKDPLGKGFHIIQGMIAIGSGGLTGKGFMQGTQTHLEFIPERTTDFIFAAFAEEFGLIGAGAAVGVHLPDPARPDDRRRGAHRVHPAAGRAITLSFFTYASSTWAWSAASCRWWACRCPSSATAARRW